MDPQRCLIEADQMTSDGDYHGARERLNAYRGWRARGGFRPEMPWGGDGDTFAEETRRRLNDRVRQDATS